MSRDYSSRLSVHKNNYNHKWENNILYTFMRNNGGWDNFVFKIIETKNCINRDGARLREEYWINKLRPSLNRNKSVFRAYDDTVISATEGNIVGTLEREKFKQQKRLEALSYYESEVFRLKQQHLEEFLKRKYVKS
jgi:hypothetical protein